MRVRAVGAPRPRTIRLPTNTGAVTGVAVGTGAVWAAVARDRTLWRITPTTSLVTPIDMSYFPTGVAVSGDDVWVTVRGE